MSWHARNDGLGDGPLGNAEQTRNEDGCMLDWMACVI